MEEKNARLQNAGFVGHLTKSEALAQTGGGLEMAAYTGPVEHIPSHRRRRDDGEGPVLGFYAPMEMVVVMVPA